MASIEKIKNKKGTHYRITVSGGFDSAGGRVRHRMVYTPEPGMTARQAEKAAQRAALDFERQIELGFTVDSTQTFSEYAAYVLATKLNTHRATHRTVERYESLLVRINTAIGHMKLADIRPHHLNRFYAELAKPGIRGNCSHAVAKIDIAAWLKSHKLSRAALARAADLGAITVGDAVRGVSVSESTAIAIADAMGMDVNDVFTITRNTAPLSAKTILEHHRLIRLILAMADKEMLVPYNAADKATPPRAERPVVNYFQPETIAQILDALDFVPLRWRVLVHMLIVTGARRGEICAIKWEKINFEARTLRIDRALIASRALGLHEGPTKTKTSRDLKLPPETMQLLAELRREQMRQRLISGDRWQETGYVFTSDTGAPIHPDSVTKWLADFSKRNGLPHINPHAFRHSAASILIATGNDIATVSAYLGHCSVSTTENIYLHLIQEKMAQASDCIANVLLRRRG